MLEEVIYEASAKNETSLDVIYTSPLTLKKFLSLYQSFYESVRAHSRLSSIEFCLDVENYIKQCNFSPTQLDRLFMWMGGYKEHEIAEKHGITRNRVNVSLVSMCKKIIEKYEEASDG